MTERTDLPEPACLLEVHGRSLVAEGVIQLRALGVEHVTVVTHTGWDDRIRGTLGPDSPVAVDATADEQEVLASLADSLSGAASDGDTVLVMQADVIASQSAVEMLLEDPRIPSGALVAPRHSHDNSYAVRLDRDRIIDCESPYHRVDPGSFALLGALKLSGADLELASAVAGDLGAYDEWPPTTWAEELERKRLASTEFAPEVATLLHPDPLGLLTTGLVRSGADIRSAKLRGFSWARATCPDEVAEAVQNRDAVDADRVKLDAAVKVKDGFFTTFFVSSYSRYLAKWAAHLGFTPNQVTVFSMMLGVAAALAFASGSLIGRIVGALLLQAAFLFDCVDGQLARYTHNFSSFGAWLDSMFDRGKEYVVYAGLAFGAVRTGSDEFIWLLATAALAAQGVRHLLDFSYSTANAEALTKVVQPPLAQVEGPSYLAVARKPHSAPIRLSTRLESTALRWPKRMITLPIGERFALISITAALWGAQVTFVALLVWGGLAALYSTTGRILRTSL
ncbi:MAG: CDP-alcohol phosphatidyltransferase family protein [Acidimicrobiia bacterium]